MRPSLFHDSRSTSISPLSRSTLSNYDKPTTPERLLLVSDLVNNPPHKCDNQDMYPSKSDTLSTVKPTINRHTHRSRNKPKRRKFAYIDATMRTIEKLPNISYYEYRSEHVSSKQAGLGRKLGGKARSGSEERWYYKPQVIKLTERSRIALYSPEPIEIPFGSIPVAKKPLPKPPVPALPTPQPPVSPSPPPSPKSRPHTPTSLSSSLSSNL